MAGWWGWGAPGLEDMSLTIWSDGILRLAVVEVPPLSVCIFFARTRSARALACFAQCLMGDVSTVSGDIAAVITAANDLNEAVSEIDTVSNSIALAPFLNEKGTSHATISNDR